MGEKIFNCEEENLRLDLFLTEKLDTSRSQIAELIKKGSVFVNDRAVLKAGEKLKKGDIIRAQIAPAAQKIKSEIDFDVSVIYEDDDIMVVNKPPFLTVHQAPSVKEPTLVDWLKAKGISLSTLSGEERNGIVHRIDKETSGALAIAKNNAAHAALSKQLENRTLGRYYLALIDYPLKEDTIVEKPIARNPKNRLKMGAFKEGRAAKSAFVKLLTNENENTELIAAKLYTGRTHQIRVHLGAIGRHILGDDLYGFKSQKATIKRVMLHAYCMRLVHPKSGEIMRFIAPLYEDFSEQLLKFFDKEEIDATITADNLTVRFDAFN